MEHSALGALGRQVLTQAAVPAPACLARRMRYQCATANRGAGMERAIERLVLGLRWLLLPLYLLLLFALLLIYAVVGRELWHVAMEIAAITEIDLVVSLCSVLDLVLLGNLLVMVAVASYESYISRIDLPAALKPEWLGKLDSGNVKVKVAVSVSMISAIHLLRAFLRDDADDRLIVLAGVQIVFILSTLGVALVDRTARYAEEPPHG
jgi:uncharacterized protein (TIGR00645 family)